VSTVPDGPAPIFISGVYRSGTTFLTAVVNHLPNVVAASSTVKYLRFCLPHHPAPLDGAAVRALLDEVAARVRVRWQLELDVEAVLADLGGAPTDHAVVYDRVMRELLLRDDPVATRWGEKLAAQWRDIPTFLELFPRGQVIHVFRDPRDVTASYKEMTWEAWPTFMDAALNCKAAMIEVPALVDAWGEERILTLRAEDLAADLPGRMRAICDFLGEPWDPALADVDAMADIAGEAWRTNTSFDPDRENYREARTRWRDHLSAEELFLVELICQPEMARFGYPGSGAPPGAVDPAALGALLADDWFAGRLQRYLTTGRPAQGYRTDPYRTEMEIVFEGRPDREEGP
jgi:hypothetical protein